MKFILCFIFHDCECPVSLMECGMSVVTGCAWYGHRGISSVKIIVDVCNSATQ